MMWTFFSLLVFVVLVFVFVIDVLVYTELEGERGWVFLGIVVVSVFLLLISWGVLLGKYLHSAG